MTVLCFVALPASAQERDTQLWTVVSAGTALSEEIAVEMDGVARLGNADGGLYETEAGGFVTMRVSPSVTIGFGYVRVTNYSGGAVTGREDRPRQQIGIDLGAFAGGRLASRVRLEQRIRSDGIDTGFRLRPRLKWTRPIGGTGDLALVLSHESFIELNDADWGQDAGLRRMRNFAGLDVALSEAIDAEIGYLNQYGFRTGRRDTMDHVLSIGISAGF